MLTYKLYSLGIRGTGKNIVTKHDLDISGRKNATTALEKFSLSMDTGEYETVQDSMRQYDIVGLCAADAKLFHFIMS